MAKVRVNNIELYYEIHGNGQPLVLIEGLGCSKWMWFKQINELKKHFKVIVFDLRGVGDSDKPDMEYSIKLLADDTAALVAELGFKKVHILGVSMGGYIAQELALEYPALVDRLILCSTHYGGPNIVPIPLSSLSIMLNGAGAGKALENLRIAISLNFSDEYLTTHKDEFEQIVKWKFEKPQPFYAYKRQFYAGLAFDEESRVHLIKSPTLIMAGKDDKIVPYENALLLHSKIKDSEVEFFDNAGHMFFIEKAEEVNQKIVEFLTKHIGGDKKWEEKNVNVGIVGTGLYIPQTYMTSEDIARETGIPEEIIRTKFGIIKKPIPGPEDHTCYMGIQAAKDCLKRTGVDPKEIDLIIYIGEEHKEYLLWTSGIKLQYEIGAENAWAFDMALRCGTAVAALKIAKDMMVADDNINTVMIAGGYRNVDFIDYKNPRVSFMYDLAAGGGAILLKKNYNRNIVLEASIITDGSFSEDVAVVGGGTKYPVSHEMIDKGLYKLDVLNMEHMKKGLEEKSMPNFLGVIKESLRKSGYTPSDIGYLAILHMKRSAHEFILNELGLSHDKSIYLENYGHMGQIDQILSTQLAIEEGKIKDGDVVVWVSAGIGYVWDAITIKWGPIE